MTTQTEEWRIAFIKSENPKARARSYEISSLGRVRDLETKEILKICKTTDGYRQFRNKRVHRIVAIAFIPNPDNKPQVNHINGIKHDNRLENLEWCTPSENTLHALATGLISRENIGNASRGRKHSEVTKQRLREITIARGGFPAHACQRSSEARRKFTDSQIEDVKLLFSGGATRRDLATQFNVSYSYITKILRGCDSFP